MGQTEQGAKAVLKREGVTSTTGEQLEDAKKKATEESYLDCSCILQTCTDMERSSKI